MVDELQLNLIRLDTMTEPFKQDTVPFVALRLMYEAARIALYGVMDGDDGGHLDLLKRVLKDYEQVLRSVKRNKSPRV
jgi:hypothetical protein